MLTADLVRTRVRNGVVTPQYVKADEAALAVAETLCSLYRDSVGRTAGELRADVDNLVGHGTDFLVWRGLAKLLDDRSTLEPASPLDAVDVRRRIFEAAFAGAPVDAQRRDEVLREVAAQLDVGVEEVEHAMYADLLDRQRIASHEPISGEKILQRYNLALAQAMLYRAEKMVIRLQRPDPDRLRYLMSALKFHRLMFRAEHREDVLFVEIDGPASLLKLTKKYGLQMAVFLPALVLMDDWELVAALDWKRGKEFEFRLSSEAGLVSHYRATGQWQTEEAVWFETRFAEKVDDWTLERRGTLVELRDGEVIVADYVLTSPDGREVAVELVSFWRAGYLRRRIELLDAVDQPFVLLLSERLKTDREKLPADLPLEVVTYKGVIDAKKVVAAAEAALTRTR